MARVPKRERARPVGWTEPVLVCSPSGKTVVPGLAWPRDGLRLSGGLWVGLDGGWPALDDEPLLIFQRYQELCVATRVSEVRAPTARRRELGLSILSQVPA